MTAVRVATKWVRWPKGPHISVKRLSANGRLLPVYRMLTMQVSRCVSVNELGEFPFLDTKMIVDGKVIYQRRAKRVRFKMIRKDGGWTP